MSVGDMYKGLLTKESWRNNVEVSIEENTLGQDVRICKMCGEQEHQCYCIQGKIHAMFDKYQKEYLKYEKIPISERPSNRRDLDALIKLNKLIPGYCDINKIDPTDPEEIMMCVNLTKLNEVATEEDILYLVRCGVISDGEKVRMNI
jgi:hypothetical protein